MSESDLDDALSDLDFSGGDDSADAGGLAEDDLASLAGDLEAAQGDGGLDIDPELEAALGSGDAGGGDSAFGADLEAAFGEGGDDGGDSMQIDPGLEASMGGGESAPSAPPSAAANAITVQSVAAGLPGIADDSINLEFLLDVKLHVTFEVGRSKMLISDLLTLGQGSVVELHRLVGDELDFLVNGKLVAKGEVVVVNEKFGCRITNIVPPEDRIKHLSGI